MWAGIVGFERLRIDPGVGPGLFVSQVFKAARIPGAGDWEIRFEYRPAHWTEAWLAASAGVLLLAGMLLISETRYRRGASSSEYPAARASSKNILTVSSE